MTVEPQLWQERVLIDLIGQTLAWDDGSDDPAVQELRRATLEAFENFAISKTNPQLENDNVEDRVVGETLQQFVELAIAWWRAGNAELDEDAREIAVRASRAYARFIGLLRLAVLDIQQGWDADNVVEYITSFITMRYPSDSQARLAAWNHDAAMIADLVDTLHENQTGETFYVQEQEEEVGRDEDADDDQI